MNIIASIRRTDSPVIRISILLIVMLIVGIAINEPHWSKVFYKSPVKLTSTNHKILVNKHPKPGISIKNNTIPATVTDNTSGSKSTVSISSCNAEYAKYGAIYQSILNQDTAIYNSIISSQPSSEVAYQNDLAAIKNLSYNSGEGYITYSGNIGKVITQGCSQPINTITPINYTAPSSFGSNLSSTSTCNLTQESTYTNQYDSNVANAKQLENRQIQTAENEYSNSSAAQGAINAIEQSYQQTVNNLQAQYDQELSLIGCSP